MIYLHAITWQYPIRNAGLVISVNITIEAFWVMLCTNLICQITSSLVTCNFRVQYVIVSDFRVEMCQNDI